jgi:cyclic 2,3-diphosphoglycerate synthetase
MALIAFRPAPSGDVREKKVYFTTTAPSPVGPSLVASLEEHQGCTVVGVSHRLADRAGLAEDLDAAPSYDVLLTELKAAAIDVAAERALERGAEVVFSDNRAETIGGDGELPDLLLDSLRLAVERKG